MKTIITKKMLKTVCGFTAAATLLMPALGFAETYRSAMFDFSGKQLVSQLSSNAVKIKDGSTVLYCQSDISAQGSADHIKCFGHEGHADLVIQTKAALGQLQFSPAEVDGKAVPVRMSYRVAYFQKADKLTATLIPNLGSMQEHYGRDYVAPQERLDVAGWYERYSKSSWLNGKSFLGNGTMSRVSATVGEDGKTDTVRALKPERAYKRDADVVKSALKKSRFIPGSIEGKPVPMSYLAVVNYQEDGSAVTLR